MLNAYQIPTAPLHFASTPEAASNIALELREPVALKILSPDIVNKSDVGGVTFGLKNPLEVLVAATSMLERVREFAPEAVIDGFAVQPMQSRHSAYELMIGVRTGQRFGPVIFFRPGRHRGRGDRRHRLRAAAVEHATGARSDVAYPAVPPLSTNRGRPVDLDDIALTLIKVSQMVVDLAAVIEMDINPIWVYSDRMLSLDANIRIEPGASAGECNGWRFRPIPRNWRSATICRMAEPS